MPAKTGDRMREGVHRWLAEDLSAAGDERGFFKAMEAVERLAQSEGGDGRGFYMAGVTVIVASGQAAASIVRAVCSSGSTVSPQRSFTVTHSPMNRQWAGS